MFFSNENNFYIKIECYYIFYFLMNIFINSAPENKLVFYIRHIYIKSQHDMYRIMHYYKTRIFRENDTVIGDL